MTKNEIIHMYINEHLLKGLYVGMNDPTKIWCKDREIIFMINEAYGLNTLYVNGRTRDELRDMFSLHTEETNDLLKDWGISNLGVSKHVDFAIGYF